VLAPLPNKLTSVSAAKEVFTNPLSSNGLFRHNTVYEIKTFRISSIASYF
jgi:hypothetical protein